MADYWAQQDSSGWFAGTAPGGQQFYNNPAAGQGDPQGLYVDDVQTQQFPPAAAAPGNDPYYGQMFDPGAQQHANQSSQKRHSNRADYGSDDLDADEVPLLEELGINFEHIWMKTLAVLNPMKAAPAEVIQDQDLAGPLVFCLLFGSALLLHGKVHFGYIYGIGVLGCVGMFYVLNLMSPVGGADCTLTCTASVLGYCLLPMAMLSMLTALVQLRGAMGLLLTAVCVVWCAASASKLFVTCVNLHQQHWLVAYPCALFYATFALLAVF